jgi:hypothetical protein
MSDSKNIRICPFSLFFYLIVKVLTVVVADNQMCVIILFGFLIFFLKKNKELVNLFSHSPSLGKMMLKNPRYYTKKQIGHY